MGSTHRLLTMIAEGEHEHQDFKYQITDAKKIARSISAFANNSGGRLLVGVKDNGRIAGASSDEEIYMVDQAAQLYCQPPQVNVTYRLHHIDGKTVVEADIPEASEKPVKAPDDNGRWVTFYRVGDENITAGATHVRVLRRKSGETRSGAVNIGEREQTLLNYVESHGGITIGGFMRLAHISRTQAQTIVVNLCDMDVIDLAYHNGQQMIVAQHKKTNTNPFLQQK